MAFALPATAKPISLYFGDLRKMPYVWDAPAPESLTFNEAIFGRLINIDGDFRLKPGLLQRFYFDQLLDGYVLELRADLKFSNGRKVTSRDLEFSILRGFFSHRHNFFHVYFNNIEGVAEIKRDTHFKSGSVKGVKILDLSRLLIKLKAPNPSFLHSLSNLVVRLVPQEELREDLFTWKKLPVGAGAYVVKSVDMDKFSVLIRPESDSKNRREFELLFAKGTNRPDISFVEQAGFQSKRYERPSVVTAALFSNKTTLGSQLKFRKSFANSVKFHKSLPSNLELATELLPPVFWGRANAQREVGKVESFENKLVVGRILNLAAKPSPSKEILRNTIEHAVIEMNAKPDIAYTKSKFLTDDGDDEADVFGFSILADYFDPLIMFNTFAPQSPLKAITLAQDKEFMALFTKASAAEDFDKRLATVKALSDYVLKQAYVVPFYYEYLVAYFNPSTIASLGTVDIPHLVHLDEIKVKQ